MSSPLPARPSLDHLRHQARDLQRAFAAGETSAQARVRDCLGALAQPGLKLAQAQCVIAREHGFPSWRKLREAVASQPVADHGDDPLHVWYASRLLMGAVGRGMLEFTVWRRDGDLVVEGQGNTVSLTEFVRHNPIHDFSGYKWEPAPAEAVWERLLHMAELESPEQSQGTIRVLQESVYPYTDWRIAVSRLAPDGLRFAVELDRIDTVPHSPTTGKRQSPEERLIDQVREQAAVPLLAPAEHALQKIAISYAVAEFHRVTIREIAELVPAERNLDTLVHCAQLAGHFTYHTGSLLAIAQTAAACDHFCPDLSRLAELVVRRLSGTLDMVRLAKELASEPTEEDRARILAEIDHLDATADFATLREASDRQRSL